MLELHSPERAMKWRPANPKKSTNLFYEQISQQNLNLSPQAWWKIWVKLLACKSQPPTHKTHRGIYRKCFFTLTNYTFDDQHQKCNILLYRPAEQTRLLCACLHITTAFICSFFPKGSLFILLVVLLQHILSDRLSQSQNQKGNEQVRLVNTKHFKPLTGNLRTDFFLLQRMPWNM